MDFGKIIDIATVASGFLCPGAAPIIGAINKYLSPEEQLGENPTSQEVLSAYSSLTPEQQEVMKLEANKALAEIQSGTDKLMAMVSVETATGNTRPEIALRMAKLIEFEVYVLIAMIAGAAAFGKTDVLDKIVGLWTIISFLITVPAGIVAHYFGARRDEKKARYSAASGVDLTSGIAGIIKAFK